MGSLSSKVLRHGNVDALEGKGNLKEKVEINDPRSPTSEISRTPVVIEKEKKGKENHSKSSLMKRTLLKNLKLDPRSPSDGINRTPIFVDKAFVHKAIQTQIPSGSPLSFYSHNLSSIDSLADMMTPEEPSINISGFECYDSSSGKDAELVEVSVNVPNDNNEEDTRDEKSDYENKTPLKVSSKPLTIEARKLFDENFSSKQPSLNNKNAYKQTPKFKALSVHCDNSENKVSEKKRDRLKSRTPLSNINSANKSSNCTNGVKKPYARPKINSDIGVENTGSPKVVQIAEWDKDNTVII